MTRRGDHYEEVPLTGEIPDIQSRDFKDHVLNALESIKNTGARLLPIDHELRTVIEENGKDEVSLDDLELDDSSGPTFKAKIVEGIGDHKKEIAATTITVAGLLVAIHQIRARKRKK